VTPLLERTFLGATASADRSGSALLVSTVAVARGLDDVIDGLSFRNRWMRNAAAMPRMIGTTSIDSLLVHTRAVLARQMPLAMTQS
jgi:hypothetical protein